MSAISYRTHYGRSLRVAAIGAFVTHLVMLLMSPPFEFKAYTMPPEPPPCLIEVEYAVTLPSDPPPEPEQPEPRINPAPGYEPVTPDVPDLPYPEPLPSDAVGPPIHQPEDTYSRGIERLPVPVFMAKAHYPDLAREAGIEGRVLVAILVDVDGKPLRAKVVSSEVTPAMEAAAHRGIAQEPIRPRHAASETRSGVGRNSLRFLHSIAHRAPARSRVRRSKPLPCFRFHASLRRPIIATFRSRVA